MATQNINNYYFNRYDIRLDNSSYFDLTLASDERDYDEEVVFSKNLNALSTTFTSKIRKIRRHRKHS